MPSVFKATNQQPPRPSVIKLDEDGVHVIQPPQQANPVAPSLLNAVFCILMALRQEAVAVESADTVTIVRVICDDRAAVLKWQRTLDEMKRVTKLMMKKADVKT